MGGGPPSFALTGYRAPGAAAPSISLLRAVAPLPEARHPLSSFSASAYDAGPWGGSLGGRIEPGLA